MGPEPHANGDGAEPAAPESADSLLEALLVDDAEVSWDPVSGEPRVARRQKSDLDRPVRSE